MKTNKVRYQDMTESERNELIAYTAGMEAHSSENIEKLRKVQTYHRIRLYVDGFF